MSNFDLNQLVNETFSLYESESQSSLLNKDLVPREAPGVVYSVSKSLFFTNLQCSESPNLKEDFKNTQNWDEDSEISFYETNSFHEARTLAREFNQFKVYKNLGSRPIRNENRLWFLRFVDDEQVELIFEHPPGRGVELPRGMINLGALGDAALAKYYFEQLGQSLNNEMNFKELKVGKKSLIFCFESHTKARKFKAWLEFLDELTEMDIFKTSASSDEMNILAVKTYFFERALCRKFWKHVQSSLL